MATERIFTAGTLKEPSQEALELPRSSRSTFAVSLAAEDCSRFRLLASESKQDVRLDHGRRSARVATCRPAS